MPDGPVKRRIEVPDNCVGCGKKNPKPICTNCGARNS